MKHLNRSWRIGVAGLLAGLTISACVGPGYDGDVGVGYVGGYYEPGGYTYGGWARGYRVGPPRGGASGPRGHGAPSIPHGSRSGGGAHGGGRHR
jgi:hypothetical protein